MVFDSKIGMEPLLELLPDAAIIADREGRIVHASTVAEAMFGYALGELVGQPVEVLMPQRFNQQHIQDRRRYVLQPTRRLMGERGDDLWGRRKDGAEFPVGIAISPVESDNGLLVLAVIRDVSERHQREQQFRLRVAALDAAANTILLADRNGRIQWVNPAFTALTGYTPEEALGNTPRLLKSGQHDQTVYQTLWQTILAGNVWQGELTNRRKDGTLYNQELTITPVRDERGEITHFIGVSQDITARKQAEEIIKREKEKLQEMNQTMMGREERVLELKHQVNALLKELGRPPQYRA